MPDINRQIEYWDSIANEKEFTLPLDTNSFGALVEYDDPLLDYGCGYGRIVGELIRDGYTNITGADVSPEMIKRATAEHPDAAFIQLDDYKLPCPDEKFNAVLLIAVLTAIPNNSYQKSVIDELFRVLKPGGFIFITDFCLQTDDRNLKRYREWKKLYGTYGVFKQPYGAILRHHDLHYIRRLTSNFELISLITTDAVTMNGNRAKAFQYYGRKPSDDERKSIDGELF